MCNKIIVEFHTDMGLTSAARRAVFAIEQAFFDRAHGVYVSPESGGYDMADCCFELHQTSRTHPSKLPSQCECEWEVGRSPFDSPPCSHEGWRERLEEARLAFIVNNRTTGEYTENDFLYPKQRNAFELIKQHGTDVARIADTNPQTAEYLRSLLLND